MILVGFPASLRQLMEGHYGYVDGGLQGMFGKHLQILTYVLINSS